MTGIIEICRRLEAADKTIAETFDLDVIFANASRLCEKHRVIYDSANSVPSDIGFG